MYLSIFHYIDHIVIYRKKMLISIKTCGLVSETLKQMWSVFAGELHEHCIKRRTPREDV